MHGKFDENVNLETFDSPEKNSVPMLEYKKGIDAMNTDDSQLQERKDLEGSVQKESDVRRNENKSNYIIGTLVMVTCVLVLTLKHTLIRMMSFASPYISVYDIIFFRGLVMAIFSSCFSLASKSYKQVPGLPKIALFFIILRSFLGVINYSSESYTVARLPLSKSTLIFSCSAITCALLAWVFLRERFGWTYVICLIGGILGVYVLSMSKEDTHKQGGVSAYFTAIIAVWATGASVVASRQLNIYKVHFSLFGTSNGIHFVVATIICSFIFEDVFHFEMYTGYDIFMLNLHAACGCAFMATYYVATQYMEAIYVGPIRNLEIMFTIFIDIFVFNYSFTGDDILGMSILAICIAILLLVKFI
ncbi:unnamed protein product [Moneuplotes crassus]|uniref:EamA domain-containing protein n=1 Tax=Euplotes crassus TaxID=5936 RepID=A0AAD1XJU0_EUPCR|nr:unnamed protein product [Moneuplotes crassus]